MLFQQSLGLYKVTQLNQDMEEFDALLIRCSISHFKLSSHMAEVICIYFIYGIEGRH